MGFYGIKEIKADRRRESHGAGGNCPESEFAGKLLWKAGFTVIDTGRNGTGLWTAESRLYDFVWRKHPLRR